MGQNFRPETRVQVGAVEAVVRVVDERTLAVAPGIYDVTVINPGGQRQVASVAVQLGSRLALPALINRERR